MLSYVSSGVSENAQKVISKRYSVKDANGEPIEDWQGVVRRVVAHVAEAEDEAQRQEFISNIAPLIERREFLPNTPCLVNAGKPNAQLAACFVLPVEDSIKGIMRTASNSAIIHQTGGGTGFTFEKLRPHGALVNTTHGVASGPVSFMEIFDKITDVVKQGGVRRGANMAILPCDHPDVLRFIHAKNNQHTLTNFNISVTITDEFMEALEAKDYEKQFIQTKFNGKPWTGRVHDPLNDLLGDHFANGQIHVPTVWKRIIESAHRWAEPGVIFIDTVNKHNLLKSMGDIRATNPCAEQALHDNNSCNLGSIDVSKFFINNTFDFGRFGKAIHWAVRFLDNVIDACAWPLPEIDDTVKRTRPVGLGIMGFADLLLKLGIRYGSQQSLDFLSELMYFFQRSAWSASCAIGNEKGAFPEYFNNKEHYDAHITNLGITGVPRNYEVTTIAPTGTISLVAETSSGIEPNFAWTFKRVDTVGERDYVHPIAQQYYERGESLPDYFVTAHDLSAEDHVRVLATAQRFVDNGVSKTCNGHETDTVEDVDSLYRLAYTLGVKSVSYYRNGSRTGQVLTAKPLETEALCPDCRATLSMEDKCSTCKECGWGKCAV